MYQYTTTKNGSMTSTTTENISTTVPPYSSLAYYFRAESTKKTGTMKVYTKGTTYPVLRQDSNWTLWEPISSNGLAQGQYEAVVKKCAPPSLYVQYPPYGQATTTLYECMTVQNGAAYNQAYVITQGCDNTAKQGWQYPEAGWDGKVKSFLDGGNYCLTLKYGEKALYTPLVTYTCNTASTTPYWQYFQRTSDGKLFNPASGYCVTADPTPNDTTPLMLGPCSDPNHQPRQKWINKAAIPPTFAQQIS
ncbi:RICIN domain-containing protein [Streptomyces sp. NPDC055709]